MIKQISDIQKVLFYIQCIINTIISIIKLIIDNEKCNK